MILKILNRVSVKLVPVLLMLHGLSGCAGFTAQSDAAFRTTDQVAEAPYTPFVRKGVESMKEGRYAEASTAFNRAIALAPTRAELHLLAALSYHFQYVNGNVAARDLAETGYLVAIRLDPSLSAANLKLGWLYLDAKLYKRAQATFLRVLDAEPDQSEATYGLAVASYYARDLKSALAAVQSTRAKASEGRQSVEPQYARTAALVYAAAGFQENAQLARDDFARGKPNPLALQQLDYRIGQWRHLHGQLPLLAANAGETDSDAGQREPAASLPEPDAPLPSSDILSSDDVASVRARDWSDCKQREIAKEETQNSYSSFSGGNDSSDATADQTIPLPALPSPCKNMPMPRMAIIEATIISSDETNYSSRGVNLLDGLQVVLGWSNVISRTVTDGVRSSTRTYGHSVGLPSAGISYSLNIANATDMRNDVLARPSLVALDRKPSTFFSGNNLTIAVSGTINGGDVEEKPIGVSLSVTPTFIDDDTMLLAVKAARSGVEQNAIGTFTQSLHTSHSAVMTNVLIKMNQTLVISGMVQQNSTTNASKTPGLGDVPGLQYLFNSSSAQDEKQTILIVLTPRKANTEGASAQQTGLDEAALKLRRDFIAKLTLTDPVQSAIQQLSSNRYVAQYKTSDMDVSVWRSPASMERLIKGLMSSYLYY